jgi:hypothetical protein
VPVDVSRTMRVPPGVAWQLLTDTRRWPDWGPTVAEVVASDPVLTATTTGQVRPLVGPWLPFRVTAFDPGHRWAWRVAGVPATGHRVEPTATGCRVVFEVPTPVAAYAAVCRLALGRIERLALADADARG